MGCRVRSKVKTARDVDRPRKSKKPPILRKEAIFRASYALGVFSGTFYRMSTLFFSPVSDCVKHFIYVAVAC